MLRFCANLSLLFTEVSLPQRFALAKQAGFTAVEIQFPYSISAEIILELLHSNELKLVQFNVAADDLLDGGEGLAAVPEKKSQFQEALSQTLDYAKILKPEVINILPGRCFTPTASTRYFDTFIENLALAQASFHPERIKTVFEAINNVDMPNFIVSNSKLMLSILDQLRLPGLFMQYDIYHMYRMGDNLVDVLTHYSNKIGHIQFADVPGRGQPGSGSLQFASIFAAIASSTYDGWVGAEYKPSNDTSSSLDWLNTIN